VSRTGPHLSSRHFPKPVPSAGSARCTVNPHPHRSSAVLDLSLAMCDPSVNMNMVPSHSLRAFRGGKSVRIKSAIN
jgi:hypothetical protein